MSTTPGVTEEVRAADFRLNFWSGSFLVVLVSSVLVLVLYFMPSTHSEYRKLVEESAPVILQERGLAVFYLGWVFCLGVVFFGIYSCYIGIQGFRKPRIDRIIFRYFSWYTLIAIALLVLGYHSGNKYWSDYFVEHGYMRCSTPFMVTGNWGQDVWVDVPSLCSDREVRDRLSSYRYSLSDVHSYIFESRQGLSTH